MNTLTLPLAWPALEAPRLTGARLKLVRAAARADRAALDAYWRRDTGVLVRAAGNSWPLTFSLDTELGVAAAYKAIVEDEAALKELENLLPHGVPVRELAEVLGLTEHQFDHFALRPGVERGQIGYALTDLRPAYFAKYYAKASIDDMFNRAAQKMPIDGGHLASLAAQAVQRLGGELVIGDDSIGKTRPPLISNHEVWDIELIHRSWEEVRSLFAGLIRRLHAGVLAPQTHLHLGVPAAVGKDATVAVARAVETLMILELASAHPSRLEVQKFLHTNLGRDVYSRTEEARGLVKLDFDEWDTPHPTHNVELRYYPDIETGLRWLALAATLVKQHRRLRVFPDFDQPRPDQGGDPLTVNLAGALKYAAMQLRDAPEADVRAVGADLQRLGQRAAKEMALERSLTLELRAEIAEYLRTRGVRERLTADRFLRR